MAKQGKDKIRKFDLQAQIEELRQTLEAMESALTDTFLSIYRRISTLEGPPDPELQAILDEEAKIEKAGDPDPIMDCECGESWDTGRVHFRPDQEQSCYLSAEAEANDH